MSDAPVLNGGKVNLIAALGTGATATVVLWMFISYSKDQSTRVDLQAQTTREMLMDIARENRAKLVELLKHQTDVMDRNASALRDLALALERIAATTTSHRTGTEPKR